MGKGWNELDLVPHRLTTTAGNQSDVTTEYTIAVLADAERDSAPGYDWISEPAPTEGSPSSCAIVAGDLQTLTPGFGGADSSIYRLVTITQDPGTTCVFDYYQRLALGSHQFSGSSLQSNLANQSLTSSGIGQKRVSIPDVEKAQSIAKSMTATEGANHSWTVTKTAPTTLSLGDSCVSDNRTATASITITWTKGASTPSGEVALATTITATNPSHRPILISVRTSSTRARRNGDSNRQRLPTDAPVDRAGGNRRHDGADAHLHLHR